MQRNVLVSLLAVGGLVFVTAEPPWEGQVEFDDTLPALSLSMVSNVPSTVLPSTPSAVPSDMPSLHPSTVPSSLQFFATDLPSDNPSLQPSMAPSTSFPSDIPSMLPSMFPSDMPSLMPTSSTEPSTPPSLAPTYMASKQPSFQPSVPPSASPSSVPSAMPSPICHDIDSYRSPLNEFECHDHRGTDCTLWRYLGLTVEQVIELLKSCPESCSIDCVDLIPFEIALDLGINQVPSFLGPSSVTLFEEISADYLNNYVPEQTGENIFFLYKVEFLSQHILERRRGLRLMSNSRRLQHVELVAKIRFTGYSLGLEASELEASLLSGISSAGFSRAVQRSGDQSFVDVEIIPALSPDSSQRSQGPVPSRGRAGVVAACIAAVLLIIGVCLYVFYRYRRSTPQAPKVVRSTSSDSRGAKSPRSLAQLLSFDSIRQALSSPRQSHDETVTENNSSNPSLKDHMSNGLNSEENDKDVDGEGDESDDNDDDVEEEHPFTGVVPYMIVYDNIEADGATDGTKQKFKNIFPSLRVKATAEQVASLRSGKTNVMDSSFESTIELDKNGISSSPNEVYFSPASSQECSFGKECDTGPGRFAPGSSLVHDETENSDLRQCTSDPEQGETFLASSEDSLLPHPRRSSSGTLNDPESSPVKKDGGKTSDASGSFIQSIFGSPGKKIRKALSSSFEYSPSSTRGAVASPAKMSIGHSRSSSRESDTVTDRISHSKEAGIHLKFHVPRHGNLGLVLECDFNGGVTIRHVKDYSPLLGMVKPDDQILSIDGVDVTTQTNLSEVTNLLRGKAGTFWTQSNTMKIVVRRAQDEEEVSSVLEVSTDSDDFLDVLAMEEGDRSTRPPLPQRSPVPVASVQNAKKSAHEHKRNKSS